jgi:hypothetical protein
VAADPSSDNHTSGMTEKIQWTLKEIREAYREILRGYDALFPIHPETKKKVEDMTPPLDYGEDGFFLTLRAKTKAVLPKMKEGAAKSGNPVIWRRGDPLEGLGREMRKRIEKAMKFGI